MAKKRKDKAAPKPPKKPRATPKTNAQAPGAAALDTRGNIGDNSKSRLTPAEEAELFGRHRQSWLTWKAKQAALDKIGIEVKAALKADGFKVAHMTIADDLGNVKGEKRVVDQVTDRLKVARWVGHALGQQYDLFEKGVIERPPSRVDWRAEGRLASINNKPRKPPPELAPDSDSYRAWMDGYSDHQEELSNLVGKGNGSLADGGVSSKDGDPVTSGTPVSRSAFKEGLAANEAAGKKTIDDFNAGTSSGQSAGTTEH